MADNPALVPGAGEQPAGGAAPAEPDPERTLVARLKAGDAAAFEEVVRSQGRRLLALARRVVGNEDDARDVFQDAMVSAFRAIGAFAGEARLSTWLHRIVVNTALMKLRQRRRRAEEPLEPLLPVFQADGHHVAQFVEWPDVDRKLAQGEVRARIREAIGRLPDTYRAVLVLRDIEGLDTRETAAALGVTENAVKIRLHRARQALRTLVEPLLAPREPA
jgi:RNA polymerase sigma-70 factor (ECF subfamily)